MVGVVRYKLWVGITLELTVGLGGLQCRGLKYKIMMDRERQNVTIFSRDKIGKNRKLTIGIETGTKGQWH